MIDWMSVPCMSSRRYSLIARWPTTKSRASSEKYSRLRSTRGSTAGRSTSHRATCPSRRAHASDEFVVPKSRPKYSMGRALMADGRSLMGSRHPAAFSKRPSAISRRHLRRSAACHRRSASLSLHAGSRPANLRINFLRPTEPKSTVAFCASPAPSRRCTVPTPKVACRTLVPTRRLAPLGPSSCRTRRALRVRPPDRLWPLKRLRLPARLLPAPRRAADLVQQLPAGSRRRSGCAGCSENRRTPAGGARASGRASPWPGSCRRSTGGALPRCPRRPPGRAGRALLPWRS